MLTLSPIQTISDSTPDLVETLRQILTKQQGRLIGYNEAQEVGESLLIFFEILAESETQQL